MKGTEMLVALYNNHHHLPFWRSPQQPWGIFDPEKMKSWVCYQARWEEENAYFEDSFMFPVIMGLHSLNLPKIMANVSFSVAEKQEDTNGLKRIWIQITTLPKDYSGKGIPCVVVDGVVKVRHLWGGDNGTYNPIGLLSQVEKKSLESLNTTPEVIEFWREWFFKELKEVRLRMIEKAEKKIYEAKKDIELYSIIPG